jgi:hypothetical protein
MLKVFLIRDVVIRICIRIRSTGFRILLFSSVSFKMPTKNKSFFAYIYRKYIHFGFKAIASYKVLGSAKKLRKS